MAESQDLIVIGGGISGLSLAGICAEKGLRVQVLEKNERPGGCIQSHRTPEGFWFELGAHTAYNSYGTVLAALERRGGLAALTPRQKVPFRLLDGDRVVSIGKQLRVLELLGSLPRGLTTKKAGQTVRDYYTRLCGPRNYARVLRPAFTAVVSQSPDDFPAAMLFKKRTRRKDVPRSFTFRGGLQTLAEAFVATPGVSVRTGAEVVALRRTDRGFQVRLQDGSEFESRLVGVAVPPPQAAALLREAFPEVARPLSTIGSAAIKTVGVVVPRGATPLEPLAGIIPMDARFHSIVSRDTVPDERRRGFAMHLPPEASVETALDLLARILGCPRDAFERVVERQTVLTSPALGHAQTIAQVEAALEGQRLLLTGGYFGGLAIEDCVIRSTQEAARALELG